MKRYGAVAGLIALAMARWATPAQAQGRCARPGDPTTPCVNWVNPGDGATVSGRLGDPRCNLDVVYGDTRIREIEFSVGGDVLNRRSTKPYACDWDTRTVANGRHTIVAVVSFVNDRVETRQLSVVVRNAPPVTRQPESNPPGEQPILIEERPQTPPVKTEPRGGGQIQATRPRILSTVTNGWLLFRRHTVVTRLTVEDVPAASSVSVRCVGSGCGFRTRRIAVRRTRDVRLSRLFARDRLRPGTEVDIRIVKAGHIGKLVRYTVLRNRRLPRRSTACLAPESGQRIRCP